MLLRLRASITYNNIRRASGRRKVGYALLGLVILLVLAGVFAFSWGMLSLLKLPQIAQYFSTDFLIQNVPIWVLSAAFLGLVLTSFGVLLQSLYLSGDMEFLLSRPVPMRAVFVAKLIEAILPNFGLICLFGLPLLFGLGAASHFYIVYYPAVVLALATLALSAAGLSSLLVMSIVRIVPARRVAEMLGAIGAILSVICSQSGQFSNTYRFSEGQINNAMGALSRLAPAWSPLTWAGRGLVDLATGRWLTGIGWSALYFALVGGFFALALVVAEKLYYTGWARVRVGGRKKRSARAAHPLPAEGQRPTLWIRFIQARISPPVRAVISKDFHTLTRDLRNMSQLITPLLFGIIYAVALARSGGYYGRGEAPEAFNRAVKLILVDANVGIALFISWSLISRLALMAFSQEGKSYWILKTSPISPARLLWAKFWVAYLPPVVIGGLFLVLISWVQSAAPQSLIYGLAVVIFSLAGAVGVNLAFGVTGANFNWDNPRRMVQGTAGCLASLVSMGYMAGIVAIFFGPAILFGLFGLGEPLGRLVGLLVGIPASLACAILPPLAVKSRLARMGEA